MTTELFSAFFLLLVIFGAAGETYSPLTDNGGGCLLGRSTHYVVQGTGACGYDVIANFSNGFDILSGVAPNQAYYFSGTTCGECYQLVGAFGAFSTFSTSPSPTAIMVMDECPVQGNELWCSGDLTHFDMRINAWNSLSGSDSTLSPFLFNYQKIACPLKGQNLGLYIVAVNQYYISFRPFWHAIAVTDTIGVMESGQSQFSPTGKRTVDNQYPYQALGPGILGYPLTVQVTANDTRETITFTIGSANVGQVFISTQQFDFTSVTQSSPHICYHPLDPVVYDDQLHLIPPDPQREVGDYWRIYANDVTYDFQSTAVTPYAGTYCMQASYSGYGTFQIAREIPIFKSEVGSLQMYLQASTATNQLQVSFNGVGGTSGASHAYFPSIGTTWSLYVLELNTTDIPNNIITIYFQYLASSSVTVYYDNISWQLDNPAEAGGPYYEPNTGPSSPASTLHSWLR